MQAKANQSFSELGLMGVDKVVAEWTHLVNKAVILSWKYDLSSSSLKKKNQFQDNRLVDTKKLNVILERILDLQDVD